MRALNLSIALLSLAIVPLGACKKKVVADDLPVERPVASKPPPDESPKDETAAIDMISKNFQRVHFDFDGTDLVGDSEAALQANAAILNKFPGVRVEVQGHADERGTTDYNLALGQRRANAIKERLERLSVASGRVMLVSFGEERPLAEGSGPSVWSKNRRAEFRVLRSPPGVPVVGTVE